MGEVEMHGVQMCDHAFTINKANADHSSSGTITLSGADLTLTQTGTTRSFTNSGTLDLGANRTLAVSGGTVQNNSKGSLKGTEIGSASCRETWYVSDVAGT